MVFLKFSKNLKFSNKFDYVSYMAYRYHHLFFRSLYLEDENYERLIFLFR